MKITINGEVTKQVNMHDASEPFMLYETNIIGADGSPVLLTSRTMGILWNIVEEPVEKVEGEEVVDARSEESIHIGSGEPETVPGGRAEA